LREILNLNETKSEKQVKDAKLAEKKNQLAQKENEKIEKNNKKQQLNLEIRNSTKKCIDLVANITLNKEKLEVYSMSLDELNEKRREYESEKTKIERETIKLKENIVSKKTQINEKKK
jgi:hypothetical protein